MNNITPTGLHCCPIGIFYHHATPMGLRLGYMSPRWGFILEPLDFLSSCHPCGVGLLAICTFLSSWHPYGIYFLVNTSYDFQDSCIYPTTLSTILHAKMCLGLPAINCTSSQRLVSSLRKSKTREAGFRSKRVSKKSAPRYLFLSRT